MKSTKWSGILCLLALLIVGASAVWAEPASHTCYVAISGDDTNPGSESHPWRTLKKATEEARPGMTVVVREGTYNERLVLRKSGTPSARITLMAQPGEAVIIEGEGIAFPDSLWNGLIDVDRQSNITISGFTVANSESTGIFVVYCENVIIRNNRTVNTAMPGILAWNCKNIVIEENEVDRACMRDVSNNQECLSVAATKGFRISDNTVHGGGTEGIDVKTGSSHGIVNGNRVYDQKARVGIYVDAWDQHQHDIEVFDNVSYGNESGFAVASENGGLIERIHVHHNIAFDNTSSGFWVTGWNRSTAHPLRDIELSGNISYQNRWGFQIFAAPDTTIEGVKIYNNLAYANTGSGLTISGVPDPSAAFAIRDVLVINNTIHGNGGGGQWDNGGIHIYNVQATGIVIRNNIVSDNVSFSIAVEPAVSPRTIEVLIDHNLISGYRGYPNENRGSAVIEGNPRFAGAGKADFHLRKGSPAIDKGSPEGAPVLDLDNSARPSGKGIDIGALEFE